jgi:putative flavoprotein involved in K+ transport
VTSVDTVIIGAGQAGLALSSHLTAVGHEHVVLERGQVAERWRTERWDSFRLLTPNWQTRLPGYQYDGPDPDGFMAKDDVVAFFDGYARSFAAPVQTGVSVKAVGADRGRWHIDTSAGTFDAPAVVVATGHYSTPRVPRIAGVVPAAVRQLTPRDYRNPAALPDGAVLVVGSGPSGQQIAGELARAGRRVYLAAGRHRPLPRHYRGADAYRWMERTGALDRTIDTLDNPAAAAHAPSVVLAGELRDLHLRRIVAEGVIALGRLTGADAGCLSFADDLPRTLADADAHTARFRALVDAHIRTTGLSVPRAPTYDTNLPAWAVDAPRRLDVRREQLGTVIWATGYRRDYSWVHADVFDRVGEPVQRRGVSAAPGLLFLGLRFMYRRKSNFIDGVGADAAYLAKHITGARNEAAA